MTAKRFEKDVRELLRNFERAAAHASEERVKRAKAILRGEGYYYVRTYTVQAHLRTLPKRKH